MSDPVISARALRKSYGTLEAVKGIDLHVHVGEVFGLLGPNGAGKTTTVEILEGLRPRSSGDVTVLGFDPDRQKQVLKDRIGVCLQATNLPDKIKVHEALKLFAAFYSKEVNGDALLKRLQLWEKRDVFYTTLSGGQKQRLALALALINDPQIIFLDEPTTGLDPQVRLEIRDLIEELRAEKRTILLTTHYIEEAERLCDRVAIIDNGVIVASGSPAELQANSANQSAVEISLSEALLAGDLPVFPGAIRTLVSDDRRKITVNSNRPAQTLVELIRWVDGQGIELEDVHLKRPTLEDVFIELTGKQLRE
jgi:ABC-2 type transport system ATP-binding protein